MNKLFESSRIMILLRLFCMTILLFIIQKPVFMLYNNGAGVSFSDYVDVVWHGIPLDITMAGYTLVLPWLILTASYFIESGNGSRPWTKLLLRPYYIVISIILALIFLSDTVMYDFWHFKLDTTVFLYLDKPKEVMASVSIVFIFMALAILIITSGIYYIAFYSIVPKQVIKKPYHPLYSLLMLPTGALLFLCIRGGVGEGTANVTKAYYSENQYLNHCAVNSAFNMFYSMAHHQNFDEEFQYFDEEECNSLTKGIYHTESVDSDTLLNTQRPNIILIVWEGCGAAVTGCLGAEEGATPNLDKLAAEGVFFSNCQANSFRTDRGLVSIMSGWLGFPTASLMRIPGKSGRLPGIARTLLKEGYTTDFWYGGDISFTSMGAFMLQNGFQKTYSDVDFPSADRLTDWGIPDGTLLDRLASDIEQRNSSTLYFTCALTLSSHEPWEVPFHRLDNKVLNSFAYTDHCIGRFVERIKKTEQWDNTLIIIVPDHGILSPTSNETTCRTMSHIPLLMTGGAVRGPKRIDSMMNQSDLAATLLGQLNIPHNDFIFSRDVMSKTYTHHTAIYASKSEVAYFDDSGNSVYDFIGDKLLNSDGDNDSVSSAIRVNKCKAILQNLYMDIAVR